VNQAILDLLYEIRQKVFMDYRNPIDITLMAECRENERRKNENKFLFRIFLTVIAAECVIYLCRFIYFGSII